MTISITQKNKAKKLYIIEGKKLDEVSQITGISVRTIMNWHYKERWKAQHLEYHQKLNEAEIGLANLYKGLVNRASESLDVQEVEAVLKLRKILKAKGGE